ncbi:hypothetical protein N0B44_26205 [Roseibacterium beibuensis]|uniref:hypothetical protein n=1 Tax=[Roseibacterium] beibuensis TaxID=1193142 RepID=UPI00217DEF89|nr:hypothetical protein [Roseibacterium beibuensis]MCS6626419.1 hypothetical protein [Roseibacterium beibuensis]
MKLLLLAAALLMAPAAAHAQVAAGTMPNTFDDPNARARAVSQPAPQTAPEPAPAQAELSPDMANEASEETLRTLIAEMQAGEPDYSRMTETIAAAVREQSTAMRPVIDGFGDLVTVDFMGSQNGIDVFNVTFANAATQWLIGINPEGKISALLFRPAE